MKNKIKFLTLILITLSFANCSSGSHSGIFSDPSDLAVDSTNDRLFISQARGELFALAASDLAHIGTQPAVSEDNNSTIHDLLPYITTNLGVYSNGSSSRIFIMGALEDESGNSVLNRIRVLDFDGTTYSEAA